VEIGDDATRAAKAIAGAMHANAQPNPVIAPSPEWTKRSVTGRLGLDRRDEVIFAFVGRRRLESQSNLIATAEIAAFVRSQGLGDGDLRTAISVFRKHYFIEQTSARGGLLPVSIQLRVVPGLELYVRAYERDRYAAAWRETVAAILNGRASDMAELVKVASESS
jgi:hypothetical protein